MCNSIYSSDEDFLLSRKLKSLAEILKGKDISLIKIEEVNTGNILAFLKKEGVFFKILERKLNNY
ncbi:MAG: hypothetical protein UR25_C0003G0140 [Candidatus Nomurabacteria bacterium GW2011_GWE1_32_28]|uniref:Uncharacterized protein n=1 Tax=Candidatus Nomurabacteria bacterium GW2011_GWF1_31_48 TaxID=1618767 RepID=A0A0G0BH28_9BACT|nr:MAG: hypothetical protein UR10_C0003G0139 [Candidatus Nomurabacteria bacterium GW2011_GWF2_30_133]KKP28779.1 MAG: hypothetical protein UR18_C0002G0191 [Candidatus Nomurabacteria bacterium GW2011_GWE2_31_40]KKP30357.1 MAG: hypothetical protein UR19_C0003G0193 [Candidatus Nomurabacteria bacterium GW2011_GWF1_31_48]KKP34884.1 MAG: hypothetical protein UR25_C0003G0140 [Candidatus Nomurabacteria bacterium GW2011_GWE1_32_28]HAS80975.1 hypothetical protein [Candidatus Nomurabacteria bacterium]